jgi:hypothetical protein
VYDKQSLICRISHGPITLTVRPSDHHTTPKSDSPNIFLFSFFFQREKTKNHARKKSINNFYFQDYNDDIRQEQLREMQMMSGGGAGGGGGASSGCSSNASCASQQDAEGQQQQQQQQHLAAVRSVAGLTSSTANVMTLNSSLHQHLSVRKIQLKFFSNEPPKNK